MRKIIPIILISLVILPSVISNGVNLISPNSTILVYAGEQNVIDIPIKNTGTQKDTIFISVWPNDWVNLKTYWVSLQPDETKSVSLIVEPPKNSKEGIVLFTITSNSLETGSSTSKTLYLNVKRKTDIMLSEIKLNKQILVPGEVLNVQPVITNLDKYNTFQVLVVTDILKDDKLIEKIETTANLEPESSKTLTHFFEIKNTNEGGEYLIKTTVKDELNKFIDDKELTFEIEELSKIGKEETSEWGIFYFEKTIELENQGNIRDFNFSMTDSIPRYLTPFFYPDVEPQSMEYKDKRAVYLWEINNLDPNETYTVSYKLNFFILFVSLVMLGTLIFITIKYLKRPIMIKRHQGFLEKDKEVSISIHVKNRSKRSIKNVVVKDYIPPVVKLVRSFDTLKPEVRTKESGIELVWKIPKVKPKEELIINYKIKPEIEVVGELKLPKAKMIHEKKKGKKGLSISKSIVIKGKIK